MKIGPCENLISFPGPITYEETSLIWTKTWLFDIGIVVSIRPCVVYWMRILSTRNAKPNKMKGWQYIHTCTWRLSFKDESSVVSFKLMIIPKLYQYVIYFERDYWKALPTCVYRFHCHFIDIAYSVHPIWILWCPMFL